MEQYLGLLIGVFYSAMGVGTKGLLHLAYPKVSSLVIPFWPLVILYYCLTYSRKL